MITLTLPAKIAHFENCFDDLDRVHSLISMAQGWEVWQSSSNDFTYGERLIVGAGRHEELYSMIKSAIAKASNKYKEVCPIPDTELSQMKNSMTNATFRINKYDSGVGMGAHVDRDDYNENAYYVVATYLNDDYDDGEILFIDSDTKIKPKAGDILIFPGNLMHKVFPVKNGNKMIITHHLNGDFKDAT